MTNLTKTREAIREMDDDWTYGQAVHRGDCYYYSGVDLKALEARLTELEMAAKALAKELNKEPLANFATDDALIDLEAALKE